MKSLAQPVLEGDAPAFDPARHEQDFLVLDVDALLRPDPLWEVEHLGLRERRRREPAAVLLPDHGRVQALLDRRPDREVRRELVAPDLEVRAVADADLVDPVEEVLLRVAREDVGHARLDAHADEGQEPLRLPCRFALELVVAELHAADPQRIVGVGRGQGHRHVHVRAARLERGVEDLLVEERLDRVHHEIDAVLPGQLGDHRPVGRIDALYREPLRLAQACLHFPGALDVDVREDHGLEPRAVLGDHRDRLAHATDPDEKDLHLTPWCPRNGSAGVAAGALDETSSPGSTPARRPRPGLVRYLKGPSTPPSILRGTGRRPGCRA